MKFKVDVKEFTRSLSSIVEVAVRETIKDFPYSGKITLKARDKEIEAVSFSGTASIVSIISDKDFGEIRYSCETEGEVTVKAVEFLDYLSSFPAQTIIVEKDGNALSMTLEDDKEYVRTMNVFDNSVIPIAEAKEFTQEISIRRETLINGLNKVNFAISDEDTLPLYHCIALKVDSDMAMFSAGNGGRFAMQIFEGNGRPKSNHEIDLKFPKEHIPTLKSVLQNTNESEIIIKYAVDDDENNIPEQMVLFMGNSTVRIKDVGRFRGYPDTSIVLKNKYSNKIVCDLKDWQLSMKAILTNFKNNVGEIHNSEVVIDEETQRAYAKSKTALKIKTPIPIDVDKSILHGDKVWFCSNSKYLDDMAKQFSKNGEIEIGFESQQEIEGLNQDVDDDEKKIRKFKKKPVLVKYPEKDDGANDVLEKFYIFFVVSSM